MGRDRSLCSQLSTLLLVAADKTNPLAWQKLFNLSGLSAGLTGTKRCWPWPSSLLHLGSSPQLYSLLLLEIYLCHWHVVIGLWMSLLWRFCSSQRLSRGSVKASRVCFGWKEGCMCHYNKWKHANCWLNLTGNWNVWLVTRPGEPHPVLRTSARPSYHVYAI